MKHRYHVGNCNKQNHLGKIQNSFIKKYYHHIGYIEIFSPVKVGHKNGHNKGQIDCFHDPIMQHVLGGSLHKNNTSCLLLGLYHASVN